MSSLETLIESLERLERNSDLGVSPEEKMEVALRLRNLSDKIESRCSTEYVPEPCMVTDENMGYNRYPTWHFDSSVTASEKTEWKCPKCEEWQSKMIKGRTCPNCLRKVPQDVETRGDE